MPAIREWLASLGLSEYTDSFIENRIDLSILPDLTDQDLKDLGVLLGDRRRILRAIAELARNDLRHAPARRYAQVEAAGGSRASPSHGDVRGPGRFDSTLRLYGPGGPARGHFGLSEMCRRDRAPLRRVCSTLFGDGVKVYFGYPEAHEDDAERAVRAGLELTAAVAELKPRAFHQVRVGIATGLVVVGHLIPAGESEERGIVGETPNLASRLQGIAEPNMVVIAEGTRRLLGDLFKLQDLGRRDLKGIHGPVRTWAVLQANSVASRFEALHVTGLSALIGREEESALLLRRWERATKGEGQVVLLSGEAGIGKSQLTAAFMERLAGEPHTRLRYFCSPQHTDSPLHPIIGQMERAARLAHNDPVQVKLDKLDALLKQTSTSAQHAALIVDMLSLPNEGRYPALELTPQQRRERTLDALILQMDGLTRSRPVLMVFEDAHWADPTSLEVFSRAVSEIANRRILLIVTFRPEFEPPWVGRAHVTALTIGRLTQFEVDGIIDQVIGSNPLPMSIRQDIIERSDGTPLFVEEMTKAVLEAGGQGAAEHIVAAVPPGRRRFPQPCTRR